MTRHLGWKFVDANLQRRGYQFVVGAWTDPIPHPKPCERGYHWCRSPLDLIEQYQSYGPVMVEVESEDPGIDEDTKTVSSRLFVHRVAPWNDRVARLFAADCAERVLHLYESWSPNDRRPRRAVEATRQYAEGVIDAAAAAAAATAAGQAAGAATWWTAARAATWAAERQWQEERLTAYLRGGLPGPLQQMRATT